MVVRTIEERLACGGARRRWRSTGGGRWRRHQPANTAGKRYAAIAIIGLASVLALAACGSTTQGGVAQNEVTLPAPPSAPSSGETRASAPADGSLTLLDGASVRLSAFRGKPTLLWFVANGCASCAASIPAVARHFAAFRRARTRILVVGIYGTFGSGAAGRASLASFGRAAAGPAFANPTWTWGLASKGLTLAYDPSGLPDEYQLLDSSGEISYRNSVPVSTMSALLGHLRGHVSQASATSPPPSPAGTTATLP